MAFIVVQFLETDEVSIISQSWLVDENTCKWPPYKNKLLIKRALLEKKPPENDWEDCEIFIMGIHETYAKAKKDVTKALNTDSDDENKKPESKRQKVDSVLQDSVLSGSQVNVKQEVSNSVSISTPSQTSMSNGNQETTQSSVQTLGNNRSSSSVLNRNRESTQVSSQNLTNGEFLSLLDSEGLLLNNNSTTQSIVLPDNVSMQLALIPSNSTNEQSETTSRLSRSINNHSSRSKSSSCDCSHSQGFQLTVLRKLNILLKKVDSLENKLKQSVPFYDQLQHEYISKFPLSTSAALNTLEEELKLDMEMLVDFLQTIGGNGESTVIIRMLERIMTNELAECYSWMGNKGKIPLQNLYLVQAIFRATKRQFSSATECSCGKVIKNWLKYAKQRKLRMEKKTKKAVEEKKKSS